MCDLQYLHSGTNFGRLTLPKVITVPPYITIRVRLYLHPLKLLESK
nr:MAG TPA: hypothetical protein [Caudoviricetes sp.]